MTILIVLTLLAVIVWYAALGRDWLQQQEWTKPFYTNPWVEWIEIKFWKKSQTILKARAKMMLGVALTILTQLGTIDLTPLLPFFSEKYQGLFTLAINLLPLVITVGGMIDEKNRNNTSTPLAIVALPQKTIDDSPEIAVAVDAALKSKVEAVAVVTKIEQENAAGALYDKQAAAADEVIEDAAKKGRG
jgi:hypothetical protein